MGVFKSTKTFTASPSIIEAVVHELCNKMRTEGYEVHSQSLISGGADISITKGDIFKAIIGMKTALKVTIIPNANESFTAEAGVGIFGQEAIPTAITLFLAWPVMIPQIWGLVQQSKLDDHVLDLIQIAVNKHSNDAKEDGAKFCSHCGHQITDDMLFCGNCGGKL